MIFNSIRMCKFLNKCEACNNIPVGGTSPTYFFFCLNFQLSRKSWIVDFDRYRYEIDNISQEKLRFKTVTISGTPYPRPITTIWCQSTFGPRGPGLSNLTFFLGSALPMSPTTDNNARDEQTVLRPNPATILRDFTLYMKTNDAIFWKRCLNYITCLTHSFIAWCPLLL